MESNINENRLCAACAKPSGKHDRLSAADGVMAELCKHTVNHLLDIIHNGIQIHILLEGLVAE